MRTPILINLEDEDEPNFPPAAPAPLSIPISLEINPQNLLGNSETNTGQIPSQTRIPIPIPGVGNGSIFLSHNSLQMPPPTWPPRPSRSGGTSTATSQSQMIQTVRTSNVVTGTGAGGQNGHQVVNTTVNLFVSTAQRATGASGAGNQTISNLWNKPAFGKYEDDTSSVLCLGEVPPSRKNQTPPFTLSVLPEPTNPNKPTTSLSPQQQQQQQFTPNSLITPPVSPRDMNTSPRSTSVSSNQGTVAVKTVAVAPKIGQKRPAPPDEHVASSSGTNKRRIAPISVSQIPHSSISIPHKPKSADRDIPSSTASRHLREHAVGRQEARIVVPKLKVDNSVSSSSGPSRPRHSESSSFLSAELRKAEETIMASFKAYMHEKLSQRYDLNKPESIRKAISMLKETNKYMQPGKKRVREIFYLIKDIDEETYDTEIQRIFDKIQENEEAMENEAEISKVVTEMEDDEKVLIELDCQGIFDSKIARSTEKALRIATICEWYFPYTKLVGTGDEIFQMLHKEKFKKIDLTGVSIHPQINKAVDEYLDKRRKELFKGFHKDGWDEMYPLFTEFSAVVSQTVAEQNIPGVTLTDVQMISDQLYTFMVNQLRESRFDDYFSNIDVYIGCTKEKADALLKADPAYSSPELAQKLALNKIKSDKRMKEFYEKFGQNVPDSTTPDADAPNQEGSEVEEGHGEEVTVDLTESDSEDYDADAQSEEETEEDRMFIDDENETEDNFRNTRPPSSASSASTISTVSSYLSNNDYFTSRPSCSSSNGVPGPSASAFANSNASTSTSTFPNVLSSSEYHNRSYLNLMDLSEQYDDISDEELISLCP